MTLSIIDYCNFKVLLTRYIQLVYTNKFVAVTADWFPYLETKGTRYPSMKLP
jgi:hypothetical protein